MPPKQAEFLDWLLSDQREPTTQSEWAAEHDINVYQLREWKKNRLFRDEWDRRALEKNTSTEDMQEVILTLKKAAKRGDVTAAKAYMNYVDKLMPPKKVERDDSLQHMSDEELETELRGLLTENSLAQDLAWPQRPLEAPRIDLAGESGSLVPNAVSEA